MEPAHLISEHNLAKILPSNFCIPIELERFIGFDDLTSMKHYTLNAVLTKEIHQQGFH